MGPARRETQAPRRSLFVDLSTALCDEALLRDVRGWNEHEGRKQRVQSGPRRPEASCWNVSSHNWHNNVALYKRGLLEKGDPRGGQAERDGSCQAIGDEPQQWTVGLVPQENLYCLARRISPCPFVADVPTGSLVVCQGFSGLLYGIRDCGAAVLGHE